VPHFSITFLFTSDRGESVVTLLWSDDIEPFLEQLWHRVPLFDCELAATEQRVAGAADDSGIDQSLQNSFLHSFLRSMMSDDAAFSLPDASLRIRAALSATSARCLSCCAL
jgi:hypothetical protein